MVRALKRSSKRGYGRRMRRRVGLKKSYRARRYTPMRRADTGSFASRVETQSTTLIAGNVIDFNNLTIALFPNLLKLAQLYQYYRLTRVEIRFKPNFNTHIDGGPSGTGQIPFLHFAYDKSGSLGPMNLPQGFEEIGVKPIRMDKVIVKSFVPSVKMGADPPTTSFGMFKSAPWIPTHDVTGTVNNTPNHMGCVFGITKTNPADAQGYDIDIRVCAQFRKPYVNPSSGVNQPTQQILPPDTVEVLN